MEIKLRDWELKTISPLLMVVLLLSSVMFGRSGCWTIAGLVWLIYPATLAPILLILWVVQSVILESTSLSLKTHPQEAQAFLDDSKCLGTQARRELRQAILMLRSDLLQGKSFEDAIAHLTTEFSQITAIQTNLQIHIPLQLPERYQVSVKYSV